MAVKPIWNRSPFDYYYYYFSKLPPKMFTLEINLKVLSNFVHKYLKPRPFCLCKDMLYMAKTSSYGYLC